MNLLQESQRPGSQKTRTRPPRYPEEFSEFAKWRYENPKLDSHRFGLTVADIDQVFFHDTGRECYIILLEVKSHGKTEMEEHEENIYSICDSVFRLARSKTLSVRLWGRVEQRKLRYMGWHLLVLSNTRPDNSEWMLWNNKYVNEDKLVRILRFELDPYTLEPAERLVPRVEQLHSIQDEVYTPPKPMKKCWCCQKNAMKEAPELGEGWYKCQECGATGL